MKPQNLIVLLSDNHNRDVMGCAGHRVVRTPNLDALASRGTRFSAAYTASPICCPARGALATGRFPHQTGYWDNVLAYDGRLPSWMHRARDAGCRVAATGKLHYRGGDDYGFTEELRTMHLAGGRGAVKNLLRGYGAETRKEGTAFFDMYATGSREGRSAYQEYDEDVTATALEWLRARAERPDGRPWILLVSWASPHPPFTVPKRLLDLYPEHEMPLPPRPAEPPHPSEIHLKHLERIPDAVDEATLRRVAAAYFALVTHLDEQVGLVLDAARTLGLLDETRLIYTSDHGELFGARGVFGKRLLVEGSAGVPLIVAGAGVPSGATCGGSVSHVDLFPTILRAVGAALAPEDQDMPGRDLWASGAGTEDLERAVFAEYHAHGSEAGAFMLRRGRHKLIHHVGMPPQLFDLAADPEEQRDLSTSPDAAPVLNALQTELRRSVDPEAVDARAKADQRARAEALGGAAALAAEQFILYSPPPGAATRPDMLAS